MANTPAWFIEEDYLASKAAQLNAIKHDGRENWTASQVAVAISQAGSTPYAHFEEFNAAEGTSPNAYFNVAYYLNAKAEQLNAEGYDGRSDWTVADVEAAFAAAGISAWAHFQNHGWDEGLNPSTQFNVAQYFADKAELEGISVEDVKAAFKEAGLDPITHYYAHGESEGIVPAAAPASDAELNSALEALRTAEEALGDFLEENEATADDIVAARDAALVALNDARDTHSDAALAADVTLAQAALAAAQSVFDQDASDDLKAAVAAFRAEEAKILPLAEAVEAAELALEEQHEAFAEANETGEFVWDEEGVLSDISVEPAVVLGQIVEFEGGARFVVNPAATGYEGLSELADAENAYLDADAALWAQIAVAEAARDEIVDEGTLFADVEAAEDALDLAEEAVEIRNELIADYEAAEALVEQLEALQAAVTDAEETIEALGFTLTAIDVVTVADSEASEIFVFDEDTVTSSIEGFGEGVKDVLYFTTKYTFNADMEAGDNNVLEFFIEQDGEDTLVHFENATYGSDAADGFTTITLTGVDAASLHLTQYGFLSLTPEAAA